MALVVLQGDLARRCAGGQGRMELKISAADYRDLVAALDARFPGFAEAVSTGTVVAIDGEIFSDPYLQPVYADSEVHFLPAIGGG